MIHVVHLAHFLLAASLIYLLATIARLAWRKPSDDVLAFAVLPEPYPRSRSRPLPRIESIAQIQMFAGAQLYASKLHGVDIEHLKSQKVLVQGTIHYFLGASRAIASQFNCLPGDLDDMMRFVLQRNLELSDEAISRLLADARAVAVDDLIKNAEGAGHAAAKIWSQKAPVPPAVTLLQCVANWGLIARTDDPVPPAGEERYA